MTQLTKEQKLQIEPKLIELVHTNNCLWNFGSVDYHNRQLKDHKWKQIASDLTSICKFDITGE